MTVKPLPLSSPSADAALSSRERLSCLMDAELDEAGGRDCIAALCDDERARGDWALWHLAADALRSSEVGAMHSTRFSQRVAAALAQEPAILAPRPMVAAPHRVMRRLVLPATAAVAALAVISFIAVPMLVQPQGDGGVQVARVGGASQATGRLLQTVPVAAAARDLPVSMLERPSALQPVQFDVYIAAHSQMSGSLGMPRTSPYLRQGGAVAEGR